MGLAQVAATAKESKMNRATERPARGAQQDPATSPSRQAAQSGLPLWYKVGQSLRARIAGRHPEDPLRLPTEAELAQEYGVSIITIRQALSSVEQDGLIIRLRRKGTFINADAAPLRSLKLLGSIDTVFDQQSSEETILVERALVPPPAAARDLFPGDVVKLSRLRKDAGEPVSFAVNYLLPKYGNRIKDGQIKRAPITKILRDELGVPIARIEDCVEAQLPSPQIAETLGIDLVSPILFFTGLTFDRKNNLIDMAYIYYRGDRYKFRVGIDVS
jgi:GntR family transcriptional regulator